MNQNKVSRTAVIHPSVLTGTVQAPPAKSMAHRLLICAGLAAKQDSKGPSGEMAAGHENTSVIRNVEASEDILATLDCLRALGAECTWESEPAGENRPAGEDSLSERQGAGTERDRGKVKNTVRIRGVDPGHPASGLVLPCRESGSTLRFFLPLCLLSETGAMLTGTEKLLSRPLSVYEDLCREQGLGFRRTEQGIAVRGPLKSGVFRIPGNVSSQFVSGLLFALPLLPEESTLVLEPPVESRPYIDLTLSALKQFGVTVYREDWEARERGAGMSFRIPGGQQYRAGDMTVEGDWSNAAFFLAMGLQAGGLNPESLQGDRICVELLQRLEQGFAEADLSDCPDLGPVLFAFAAAHHGGRFTGTRRLRDKESDRVQAMAEELSKFGVRMTAGENDVTIRPVSEENSSTIRTGAGDNNAAVQGTLKAPAEELDSHNDHRIAMALTVLCLKTGGIIRGAEAVDKSFPDFFERLRAAGAELRMI